MGAPYREPQHGDGRTGYPEALRGLGQTPCAMSTASPRGRRRARRWDVTSPGSLTRTRGWEGSHPGRLETGLTVSRCSRGSATWLGTRGRGPRPRTRKWGPHGPRSVSTQPQCFHRRVSFCPETGRPLVSRVITTPFFNFWNFLNFLSFAVMMDSQDGCWWEGDGDSLLQLSKFSELFFFFFL